MRDECRHGQLHRQCETCDLEAERDDLRTKLAIAREAIKDLEKNIQRRIDFALAQIDQEPPK